MLHRASYFAIVYAIALACCNGGRADVRLRVMAANISSGNNQSYDPGHGARIFRGVAPDIVLIQEFNIGANTPAEIRAWIDATFAASFHYYREAGAQIPNGIISRFPILASGEWDDVSVSNRDFAWARIDVPGGKDLWAISVHLLTASASARNAEAAALRNFITAHVPAGDYLVVGGDFNTAARNEAALGTLSSVVVTSGPYPADKNNNGHTNASRAKPYDWVLADPDLHPLRVATVIGAQSFAHGLVFDSRIYTPLSDVDPVLPGDSGAANMQHMAVVRDFLIPDGSGGAAPQVLLDTSDTVGKGVWKNHTVSVPAGKTTMTVTLAGTTGDADLYIRKAASPTTDSYDFRPYLGTSNEQVIISAGSTPPLANGTWHISVNGYSTASFALKVVVE